MSKINRLKVNRSLLNPFFEGYKFQVTDEHKSLTEYRFPPSIKTDPYNPNPNNISATSNYFEGMGYKLVQKLSNSNHIFEGPKSNTCLFISTENDLVSFSPFTKENCPFEKLVTIPHDPRNTNNNGYKSAISLDSSTILLFDGYKTVYIIEPKKDAMDVDNSSDFSWEIIGKADLGALETNVYDIYPSGNKNKSDKEMLVEEKTSLGMNNQGNESPYIIILSARKIGSVIHILACVQQTFNVHSNNDEEIFVGIPKPKIFESKETLKHLNSENELESNKDFSTDQNAYKKTKLTDGSSFKGFIQNIKKPSFKFFTHSLLVDTSDIGKKKNGYDTETSKITTLNLERKSCLVSNSIPEYAAYTMHRFDYMLGTEDYPVLLSSQSKTRESPSGSDIPMQPENQICNYNWVQTPTEITIYLELENYIESKNVNVEFTNSTITLTTKGVKKTKDSDKDIESIEFDEIETAIFENKQLFDLVDKQHCYWTIESGKFLTLYLNKHLESLGSSDMVEDGKYSMKWPQLFSVDDGVLETIDPSEIRRVTQSLEKFTNNSGFVGEEKSEQKFMDSEYDIDADNNTKNLKFCVYDYLTGNGKQLFENDGGMDFICQSFESLIQKENILKMRQRAENDGDSIIKLKMPLVCLKHDIDGVVFLPTTTTSSLIDTGSLRGGDTKNLQSPESLSKNIASLELETDDRLNDIGVVEMEAVKVYNALNFVLASKTDKKHVYVDHLHRYAIAAESFKRLYIYRSNNDKSSNSAVQNVVELISQPDTLEKSETVGETGKQSIFGLIPMNNGDSVAILCKRSIFVYDIV
ncbi:hypothetical protein BB558_003273 [Smittium angustum]|uniref:NudC domain-containing protein 1 n=1 Tax=Smittium angustum TaxID=133377 RepID=A0A2U1J6T1_SMIAN|nr:hypothetical protein BB558_003273 [Smittium angustum]